MRSLNWKDLHLTPNEYVDMFTLLLKKSDFFTDMDGSWHPEDLASNAEVVFETMNDTLVLYLDVLRNKMLSSTYDPNKKTVDDMKAQAQQANPERTQVFGGTLPRGEWDNYEPTYAGNNVFGDNS